MKNSVWSILGNNSIVFFIGIIASLMSVVASFSFFLLEKDPTVRLRTSELASLRTEIQNNSATVENLKKEIKSYEQLVSNITSETKNADVAALVLEVQRQEQELDDLKEALGGDVERALSVALLRKDLEAVESKTNESLDSSSRSVDRVYDQNKWFLGLMATMTLSVIGLTISAFNSRKKEIKES